MTGKISDKYTIIPQYKGNYTIKPIRFSYFDYAAGAYKTLTSQEIVISVLDGPSAGDKQDIVQENAVVKNQISNSDQFKYIHLKTKLSPINKKAFFGSTLFYVLLGLPFLLIPLIILFKKKKEAIDGDVVGNKLKLNTKLAKKFLSEAKKQIGTKEPFYVALERSLHNFLKAKLKIETSEMSKDKIRATLTEKKAQPETIDLFIQLTENCEFARYAPSTTVAMQQDYDKAVEVISELEKQIV